jgi:thiamine pyrophosphokinase
LKKAIILAGGSCPDKRVFHYFRETLGYNLLICADGGLRHTEKLQAIPDFIVGDLDSAPPELLKKFRTKSEIIRIKRQTDTDAEKAIKFCLSKKISHLVLFGADGERVDHELGNLSCLLKFKNRVCLAMVGRKSIIHPVDEELCFEATPGEIVSLFSFSPEALISTTGLKYPLRNETMPFGVWESVSNVAIGGSVSVSSPGGKLLLFRSIESAIKQHRFYEH